MNQLKKVGAQSIEMPAVFRLDEFDRIESITLVSWLMKKQEVDNETNLLLESLYAALLEEIQSSLLTSSEQKKIESSFWHIHFKSILLAVSGTIFFGCEGFDGVFAMLGICSLPAVVFFSAGIVCSTLSILGLYAFYLIEMSKKLGVDVKNVSNLLDIYIKEIETIKAIRKKISLIYIRHKSSKELEEDLAISQLLMTRYKALDDMRDKLRKLKDNSVLMVAKYVTAAVTGIIFFSGGFFAGQTVALEIAGLFMATVTPTFWPIILASIVVGLAAFSVYWFVERPDIENIISRWVGLEQEKIDDLCNDVIVKEQKEKLAVLEQNIKLVADQIETLEKSKQELHIKNEVIISIRETSNTQPKPPAKWQTTVDSDPLSTANYYCRFHSPLLQSKLVDNLPRIPCKC